MKDIDFNVGSSEFGKVMDNKGGFNFLNIPENLYNEKTFFDLYNKPFLEKAIERGDDIVLATKSLDVEDFVNLQTNKLKGMYAEELRYLSIKNIKPINLSDNEWIIIKSWFK